MKKHSLILWILPPLLLVAAALFFILNDKNATVSPSLSTADIRAPERPEPYSFSPQNPERKSASSASGRRAANVAKYLAKHRQNRAVAQPEDLPLTQEDLSRLQEEDLKLLEAELRTRGKQMTDELLSKDLAVLEPEQKDYLRKEFTQIWEESIRQIKAAHRAGLSAREYERESEKISLELTEKLNQAVRSVPPAKAQREAAKLLQRRQETYLAEIRTAYGAAAEREMRDLLKRAREKQISEEKFMALQNRLLEKFQAWTAQKWREELRGKLEREKKEVLHRHFGGVPKDRRPAVKQEVNRIYTELETSYVALYNSQLDPRERERQRAEAERRAVSALNRLLAKVTSSASSVEKKVPAANSNSK